MQIHQNKKLHQNSLTMNIQWRFEAFFKGVYYFSNQNMKQKYTPTSNNWIRRTKKKTGFSFNIHIFHTFLFASLATRRNWSNSFQIPPPLGKLFKKCRGIWSSFFHYSWLSPRIKNIEISQMRVCRLKSQSDIYTVLQELFFEV